LTRASIALALLLVAGAAHADERVNAVYQILPGTRVRLTTQNGTMKGEFLTNRADSLFLRSASQRVALSYDDLHRIEVKVPSVLAGLAIGAALGGAIGAVAASGPDEDTVGAMFGGLFVGGLFGGLIGKSVHHWRSVYPAKQSAPPDTTTKHH